MSPIYHSHTMKPRIYNTRSMGCAAPRGSFWRSPCKAADKERSLSFCSWPPRVEAQAEAGTSAPPSLAGWAAMRRVFFACHAWSDTASLIFPPRLQQLTGWFSSGVEANNDQSTVP